MKTKMYESEGAEQRRNTRWKGLWCADDVAAAALDRLLRRRSQGDAVGKTRQDFHQVRRVARGGKGGL